MSVLLENKVAVVTGSTRGIGFSIAKEFAENNGATTVVCSRNKQQAERAMQQIGGNVFAAEIDVTNDFSVKEFMQQILSKFGRIDILVNNAGYPFDNKIWYKRLHEGTDEELQKIMRVDLQGSVRVSRAVIGSILKENTLKRSDLDDFVACYNPKNRHERKESERFKSFAYEELTKRDKLNLDIFWLKDESLEDSANLTDPDIIAQEIVEDLEAAVSQFATIAADLKR